MQSTIVQLNNKEHQNIKLTPNHDFTHVASHHVTPVLMQELGRVAADLPVAFIKNSETGDYLCVALLGLKEGENLLVKDGQWQGTFIPAGYTHYPLALVPYPEDAKKYVITIDMASNAVSDNGDALFNEDGTESEYLQKRRQALETYYKCAIATREFTKTLVALELLEEKGFTIEVGEDKRKVTGIHVVNEEKFNALPDDKIVELHKKGYLGAVYAHMISLSQTPRLVNRLKS